jgi:hypothetical protein
MTYQSESEAPNTRSRSAWPLAIAAVVLLVVIAVVAVLAFQGLHLLRPASTTEGDTDSGVSRSAVVTTPEPTQIMPSMFAPPDRWLAGAG